MQMKRGTVIAALGLLMLSGRQNNPPSAVCKRVQVYTPRTTRLVPHGLARTVLCHRRALLELAC